MKYMTFNSSCSYAGAANMLEQYGVDTTDRAIALDMKLPYLFAFEDGIYKSGPMLQSACWFNLYLNRIGYEMTETQVPAADVRSFLLQQQTAMLGMRIDERTKHAVVYIGARGSDLIFLNNKWEHTDEPERLVLSADDMPERLDKQAMIATLKQTQVSLPEYGELLSSSCSVLERLGQDIRIFCTTRQTHQAMLSAMNAMFRAVLLDGITMLELIGNTALAEKLRSVQADFLSVVRSGNDVIPAEIMQMDTLSSAINEYIALIEEQKISAASIR